MDKLKTSFLSLIFFLSIIASINTFAVDFYFDGSQGNDESNGLSPETAWKSLSKVDGLSLHGGDRILLKRGTVFSNQYITLNNQRGELDNRIYIGAYSEGPKPVINLGSLSKHAIMITSCEHIEVENLEIKGGRGAVFFTWINQAVKYKGFVFHNLYIHESYQSGGSAFQLNNIPKGETKKSEYEDVLIENCQSNMIVRSFINAGCINRMMIRNNDFKTSGGPGIVLEKSIDATIRENRIDSTGSMVHPSFSGRGSCAWVMGCRNVLVEKNILSNAGGWLDSYGFHCDINNNNVIVQYNLSKRNAGGFVQILGQSRNCAYRYNISVNDGWRVKNVFDNPSEKNLEDGCVISLNGYLVNDPYEGPYNSYIYNNTIYVRQSQAVGFNYRYTLDGAFIANNIFHLMGTTKSVVGARKGDEPASVLPQDVVYKHNIYLRTNTHPSGMLINDSEKIIGDVRFANPGGLNPEDYIPANTELIKDKSIPITFIPGDVTGLFLGFALEKDFFGNPIVGTPDMGAVEILATNVLAEPESFSNSGSEFKVYPIPAHDDVWIEGLGSGEFSFELFNYCGSIVSRGKLNEGKRIALDNLTKGIYFLKINGRYKPQKVLKY